jgi:hemoglobin/transferrin/lactoferrin receptor protein
MKLQHRSLWAFTLLSLAGQIVPGAGWSADTTGKAAKEAVALEDMVITGTRTERSLAEVPVSISVIDDQEIERSSAATVGDLFKDVPGVEVLDTGVMAGQKRIMIRGESGSRVLILVDGQKISEQKAMDGAALLMDMNNIERIEVVKGPASVLYGSEGLSGAVNVITKREGEKLAQMEASTTLNSNTDGWNNYLSVFGGGDQLAGFGYRFSNSRGEHGNRHGAETGELDHTDYGGEENSAYLSYDLGLRTNTKIKISGLVSRYSSHTNNYLYEEPSGYDLATPFSGWAPNLMHNTPPADMEGVSYFRFEEMALPEWNRDKEALFFEWNEISEVLLNVKLNGYHQKTDKHFIAQPLVAANGWYPDHAGWYGYEVINPGIDFPDFPPGVFPPDIPPYLEQANRFNNLRLNIDSRNIQDTDSVNLESHWFFFDSHSVILGAEQSRDDLSAVDIKTYLPGSMSMLDNCGLKTTLTDADRVTKSAYGQDEWEFLQDWLLIAGLRYTEAKSDLTRNETSHLHQEDPLIGTLLQGGSYFGPGVAPYTTYDSEPQSESSEYNTSYQVGLVNNSIKNLSLRANWATAFTLPTLSQLYIWASHSGTVVKPNPDLAPEEAYNYELGARYKTERWDLDLSLYSATADKYIASVDIVDPEASLQYQNINSAKTSGVELAVSYCIEPWGLTPYASGYYIRREFIFPNGFSTTDTMMPHLQGRFGLRYSRELTPGELWVDLYGRAARGARNENQDGELTDEVPGWQTANISCGLNFDHWLDWSEMQLIVEANNIFDRSYVTAHEKIMEAMGRYYTAKLVVKF